MLVVSQTRQDIASRAYVSHLNMRIRVAVVRLHRDCHLNMDLQRRTPVVSKESGQCVHVLAVGVAAR